MQELTSSVIQGFPFGCVFALVAIGLVLTYKTSGVFNLAFGAQAFAAAAVYYELRVKHGWPIPSAAIVAVLVVSPLLGVLLDFGDLPLPAHRAARRPARGVDRPARRDPRDREAVWFGELAAYGVEGIVGNGDTRYNFFGYAVDRDELATIIVTLALVVGLTLMFRYTTIGLRMRAVVESPRMTELAGINADRVSSAGWMLSSMLAGLAGVLLAPLFPQLVVGELLPAGRRRDRGGRVRGPDEPSRSRSSAVSSSASAGQILARYLPTNSILAQGLRPSLPFVVLFFVLILRRRSSDKKELTDPLAGCRPAAARRSPPTSAARA